MSSARMRADLRARCVCGARAGIGWIAGLVLAGMGPVTAQISVSGVSDEEIYTDRVSFTISVEAGWEYEAQLNGRSVAVGAPVEIAVADYYQLHVERTSTSTAETQTLDRHFIVRASDRGSSEWGLPRFSPTPPIPSADAEFEGSSLELVVPAGFPAGLEIPVIARIHDAEGRVGVNGAVAIDGYPDDSVDLLRGIGSGFLPAAGGEQTLQVRGSIAAIEATRTVAIEGTTTWTQVSGAVGSSTDWGEDARVHVTGKLDVAAGATLTIGAGSVVRVAPDVEIEVAGTLVVNGTRERPVVFCPEDRSTPWGGFLFRASTSRGTLTGAILTGSGADPRWFSNNSGSGSSHRGEQPLVYLSNGARVTLTDCYLIDNEGQAGHGESSYLTMTGCLVQRCITTGQYNGGAVVLDDCALIEFPAKDAPFEDEDNDAFYLTGGAHVLRDCLVGWALDDAIDAGSGSDGSVTVERCWLESCYHEGFAWSRGRTASSVDSVTINCGQGIECGHGTPEVTVERSLSTANAVGVRFGDNYDWDYDGSLEVRDSLLLYNGRDVFTREWDTWEEHPSAPGSEVYIRDCYLTEADPSHPDNAVWDGTSHAALLEPFLPTPATTVGVGIALWQPRMDASRLAQGVPVGLSTFTTQAVSVGYAVDDGASIQAEGVLLFRPGESVRWISLEGIAFDAQAGLRVTIRDPVAAQITGLSEAYVLPDPRVTILPAGSAWRYSDAGQDLGTAWREPGYDDSEWPEGPAQLGYGEGDEATEIQGGPSDDRYPTVYFRRSFDVASPAAYEGLEVRLRRDDGAIVYLNGTEVLRSNMPAGAVGYSDWAADVADDDGDDFHAQEIDVSLLVAGANVIAVEVHQADATSSDVSFDLELSGFRKPFAPGGFVRSDSNGDERIDVSDPVRTLLVLFLGETTDCRDALDADDDGAIVITDAVYTLNYLFLGGPVIPAPFPMPGEDPTPDDLDCER